MKYEVAVRRTDGKIVWIAGPSPGRRHDLYMHKHFNLRTHLRPGERICADKGYIGKKFPYFICPKKGQVTEIEKVYNRIVNFERSLVECVIGRIKKFRVLMENYRHDFDSHGLIFNVAAELTNIDLRFRPIANCIVHPN